MLFFATVQIVLRALIAAISVRILRLEVEGRSLWPESLIRSRIVFAEYIFLVTNNALTDGLFTYRCYVVWERTKYIIILPMILLASATILGYVGAVQNDYFGESTFTAKIAFILSGATNVMITMLTAGRIWWAARRARIGLLEPRSDMGARMYNTAVAMLLESGAIYSVSVIAYIVSGVIHTPATTIVQDVVVGALPQIVNIVPILIIVRVGLMHRDTQSRETSAADLSFVSMRVRSFAN
ncbi:hypothetical protein FB451DRAFT_327494 [Mycena latifolia]|nr:hypothetical protein FB451DRAFT_327494 [Mycena latifolia]